MTIKTNTNDTIPKKQTTPEGVDRDVFLAMAQAEHLKKNKEVWNSPWQLLGEFIHMRKQQIQTELADGEFLTHEIFDSSGPKASKTAASTLVSMLWPATDNRIAMLPPESLQGPDGKVDDDVREWYDTRSHGQS